MKVKKCQKSRDEGRIGHLRMYKPQLERPPCRRRGRTVQGALVAIWGRGKRPPAKLESDPVSPKARNLRQPRSLLRALRLNLIIL